MVDAHVHAAMRLVAGPGADLVDAGEGGQVDARRAGAGGLRIAFSAALVGAWEDGDPERIARLQIEAVDAQAAAAPQWLAVARSPAEARRAAAGGRLVLVHALENGRDLEGPAVLDRYRDAGVRMVGLVHARDNDLGDSGEGEARWGGLSPLGRQTIARANELGLWVDLSHASEATVLDAARVTHAPLIASHTASAALVPGNPANLSDAALRAIAGTGGLACVFFGSEALLPGYLTRAREVKQAVVADLQARGIDLASREAETFAEAEFRKRLPRATVDDVADHLVHIIRVAGAKHACIGSDFDGIGPTAAHGLDDASRYPALLDALRRRGIPEADIADIAGGNVMRTWTEVMGKATR